MVAVFGATTLVVWAVVVVLLTVDDVEAAFVEAVVLLFVAILYYPSNCGVKRWKHLSIPSAKATSTSLSSSDVE